MKFPLSILHIISVARALKNEKGKFEKGVRAYLMKEDDHYLLSFKHTKAVEYEGIFFKEHGTDFNNGVFKFMKNKETIQVNVTEDCVTDFTNVSITQVEADNDQQ